jgi:hypothetical protein
VTIPASEDAQGTHAENNIWLDGLISFELSP